MKKFFFFLILHSTLYIVNCFSQQYGWVDISNNLPSSNGTASLSDMHWLNENEGWICSSALGEIYHTTDGGQTFETQTTQFYTNAIYMLNSSEGYAGGYNGRVYKTTNGGADWFVHGSIGGTLLDIDFPPNSDSGYCCGENGKIYKITSAGINAMSSGVISNLRSISFPTSTNGWTCGDSFILKYENEIWNQQDPPVDAFNDIFMISDLIGWAVGALGVIVKTENGGDSSQWNYQTNPDQNNRALLNIFALSNNEAYCVGNSGVVLQTTDGGNNWNIILDGLTNNMLRSVQFTSSTNGYILGNNKTLFKYGLLTNVEQQSTQPTEFKLEQNYPNPFNPSTKIKYTIPTPPSSSPLAKGRNEVGFVTLKVYDILGNEIATLVDEERAAGIYNVQFTMNNLASGVYLYKIIAGGFVQTKKMILIR